MPITLGGRTYSDDEVRQFYANGGNEAAFAQQNGLSDADAQAAMAQAHSITASPTNWGSATPQQIQDQSAQWTAQGIDFAEQARRAEAAGVNKDTLNMWSAQNHGAGRLAIDNAYSNYWLQQGRDPDGRANDLTTYNRLGPNTSGNLTDAQQLAVAARTGYGQPSSPAAGNSFTGNNSVDHNKGVFSPTENRWISNDEIKQYFSSNPGASADQINGMAGKLGLNPYAINYAAWQGTGGGDPRNNQQFLKLGAQLDASQYRGSSGYGTDFDAAHQAGTQALTAGAGNVQYQMPNGSYHSVRVHNGRPDQTYEQVLGNLGSLVGGSQPAGIINSAAGQLSQGDQSSPTVVADGGQYLPDGTWSDLVNGKHTGTISPGTYAQSKIGSF